MKDIELTISTDYAKHWGIHEALRELYQNAFDREDEGRASSISTHSVYEYYGGYVDGVLTIGNRRTELEKKTLIFGNCGKKGSRGMYGEGYKLAFLVLLREGCSVKMYNGDEIWTPVIYKSRKFDTEMIKIKIEKKEYSEDFDIVIDNLNEYEYESYRDMNVRLKDVYNYRQTVMGQILTDEEDSGKIYVGGLYVITDNSYKYGYNINHNEVELDRDRQHIQYWELRCVTTKMHYDYYTNTEFDYNEIYEMIEENDDDFSRGFNYMSEHQNDNIYNIYCKKHNIENDVLFAFDKETETRMKHAYANRIENVGEAFYNYLIESKIYKGILINAKKKDAKYLTPHDLIAKIRDAYCEYRTNDLEVLIEEAMERSINWREE